MHKRLYKGGTTRLRDITPIVDSFGKPFARACLCSYTRGSPKWSEHCIPVVVERRIPFLYLCSIFVIINCQNGDHNISFVICTCFLTI